MLPDPDLAGTSTIGRVLANAKKSYRSRVCARLRADLLVLCRTTLGPLKSFAGRLEF